MSQMIGADTGQLRATAARVRGFAELLGEETSVAGGAMERLSEGWHGQAQGAAMERWAVVRGDLRHQGGLALAMALQLEATAERLERAGAAFGDALSPGSYGDGAGVTLLPAGRVVQTVSADFWLDRFQDALGVAGLVEGWGTPADLLDAGISFLRGDTTGALIALLAAVPVAGVAAGSGRVATRATRRVLQARANAYVRKLGPRLKEHPLRQAYEARVRELEQQARRRLQLRGNTPEAQMEVARWAHQKRRSIGEHYKEMTPEPLREYIYDVNRKRYNNDPLGPSFEYSLKKAGGDPLKVIESSSRPNIDVDKLLVGFEQWLVDKGSRHLK